MHSSLVSRPNSVIQIIDIPDASENNPQPITKNEEVEFNELITTKKLKEITAISNLFDLYELKIKVNTSDTSIGNIGKMAPNLKMLNLNNSHIQSIRDLGTNLSNLTILWLSQCNLIDLDGIVSIPNIKELYLPYNEVSDISPLGMMEKLEVLDLEGNNIDDISQVEFLSFCVNLTSLTLKGNPIELSPSSKTQDLKDYMYENAVLSRIPQLSILDEAYEKVKKPLFLEEIKNPFTKDFLILQQRLKYLEHSEASDKIENCKPPSPLKRVCFSQSHEKIQKAKNYNKDTTCYRSSEVASQLTNGTPLCGNPVQALRSRIKNTRNIKTDNYLMPQSTCKDNELPIQNGEQLMSDVFEELRLWRSNNCRQIANKLHLHFSKSNLG